MVQSRFACIIDLVKEEEEMTYKKYIKRSDRPLRSEQRISVKFRTEARTEIKGGK